MNPQDCTQGNAREKDCRDFDGELWGKTEEKRIRRGIPFLKHEKRFEFFLQRCYNRKKISEEYEYGEDHGGYAHYGLP